MKKIAKLHVIFRNANFFYTFRYTLHTVFTNGVWIITKQRSHLYDILDDSILSTKQLRSNNL